VIGSGALAGSSGMASRGTRNRFSTSCALISADRELPINFSVDRARAGARRQASRKRRQARPRLPDDAQAHRPRARRRVLKPAGLRARARPTCRAPRRRRKRLCGAPIPQDASGQFAIQLQLSVSLSLGQLAHEPSDGPLGCETSTDRLP